MDRKKCEEYVDCGLYVWLDGDMTDTDTETDYVEGPLGVRVWNVHFTPLYNPQCAACGQRAYYAGRNVWVHDDNENCES